MTADADVWSDLAARCEGATGPSRELDLAIEAALAAPARIRGLLARRPYTGSIDAIVGLIEARIGAEYEITTLYGVARVGLNLNHGPKDGPSYGSREAGLVPLALCIAFCRHEASHGARS